jgi:hypothetical protein
MKDIQKLILFCSILNIFSSVQAGRDSKVARYIHHSPDVDRKAQIQRHRVEEYRQETGPAQIRGIGEFTPSFGSKAFIIGLAIMLLAAPVAVAASNSFSEMQVDKSCDPSTEQCSQMTPEPKLFEINGVSKPFLGHITQALLYSETDPFSVTSLIRFKDNRFILKGDLLALDEEDLHDIDSGNFVYVPYYTLGKTRLSMGSYEEIGAVIVGSSDPSLGQRLHFAAVRSTLPN